MHIQRMAFEMKTPISLSKYRLNWAYFPQQHQGTYLFEIDAFITSYMYFGSIDCSSTSSSFVKFLLCICMTVTQGYDCYIFNYLSCVLKRPFFGICKRWLFISGWTLKSLVKLSLLIKGIYV